jgi:EPS-associated MarR family transcriptional regulator
MEPIQHKILGILAENPNISQRELADKLGVSLGKTNYCLKAIIEKGLIKVKNFRSSKNKLAYAYYLTPKGFEEKTRITIEYIKRKILEYESIKREIQELQSQAKNENICLDSIAEDLKRLEASGF